MEHVALIYKILVLSIMIDQMNIAVQRLDLPQTSVTNPRQLKEWDVFAPNTTSEVPRGYVRTDKYHFAGFAKGICLFRLNSEGLADWPDPFSDKGVHGTNANNAIAYDLSRGWLEAIGVDVEALLGINRPRMPVERHLHGFFFQFGGLHSAPTQQTCNVSVLQALFGGGVYAKNP